MNADDVIQRLGLEPHPEGGWYRETWRDAPDDGSRGAGTAIYFLLAAGERSAWHRIDADEIWHHYAGDPLVLRIYQPGAGVSETMLGTDLVAGQNPQARVPASAWQSAEATGAASSERPESNEPARATSSERSGWTLVGCTVSPAFEFSRFELAPPGWTPGNG